MRALLRLLLVILIVLVAYLCLWPVPAEPKVWRSVAAPGYVGVHAPNCRLTHAWELSALAHF
jgi:hypothetical protein